MENKEIMERLLESDVKSQWDKKVEDSSVKFNKDDDLPISRIRIVTAKYKVYIVLLLIFICLFLLEYIPSIKNSYTATKNAYQQANSDLIGIQYQIKAAEEDVNFLWEIVSNEDNLRNCLNEKNKRVCSILPKSWMEWEWENKQYNLSIPLSYLQIHSLYNKKMPVDEKKVLKNLNEYLIKENIDWTTKTRVWDIQRISIWDPEAIIKWDEHFFQVPVEVSIEFTTIGDLTWFLYNVEKKLINNGEDRILYKIQSVSYDIISRDEPQTTDIEMLAYYYYDEKFEWVKKEVAPQIEENNEKVEEKENNNEENNTQEVSELQEEAQENTDNNQNESNNKSESFFSKIFRS